MAETVSRVGIFGGSFNPIHVGHLILAEWVRVERSLHRLLFVPAASPPHKPQQPLAAPGHRLRMVELAVQGHEAFRAERIELERDGPSYTLQTVRELRDRLGPGNELLLVMGADSLLDLPNWWHADELVREVPVIVFARPGYNLERGWERLAERFGSEWVKSTKRLRVRAPLIELSATGIRERVRAGLSIRYMVPEPVRAHILEHGLYAG